MTLILRAAMIAAVSTATFAVANAQTSDTTNTADTPLSEVKITGSRTITNGNDSPTPLTVMSTEDLAAVHPATVAEGLNELPIFSGSRSQNFNPANAGQPQGNNNANVLNLRAIGVTRTLILYDGHRVPPTTVDGLVDVNMIPQMLLKRVDVVTGGASAVYGSDAVSGVVNFVTDTKFEGLKANLEAGVSEYSDPDTVDAGIAFGTSLFGKRGHWLASYQHRHDPGISRRSERPLGLPAWTLQGNGSAAYPYFLVANARNSNTTFGGLITNGVLNGQRFDSGGALVPFVHGSTAGVFGNTVEIGGDGSYNDTSLRASLDMDQLYTRFDYDFTDNLRGFITASGTSNDNWSAFQNLTLGSNGVTLSARNAFLLQPYQAQLAAAGQTTFRLGKSLASFPRQNSDISSKQYFVNTGLEGVVGDGYKWEVAYSDSKTKLSNRQNANINNGRLYAALDAVVNPANGEIVCNVTLTNPTLYPGCVPINVFGEGSESQAAMDYVLGETELWATTTMDDVSANISGAPFSSWAGPINVALSGEWRRLGLKVTSNAQPGQALNCTGLRFNCTASSLVWFGATMADRSLVTQTVSEGAVEMDVPVLTDHWLAQDVSINAAARYTHYDTSGNAKTWKAGVDWHFNESWTLRGTRSRDIRAPNLYDLYAPTRVTTNTYQDTLTGLSPAVTVVSGGNPNLKPEVAYTSTLGFVYGMGSKLSVALDGFHIDISDAITNIQGNDPLIQANCYASGGTSASCTFQERPLGFADTSPANVVTKWYQQPLNFAQQRTYGADLEANFNTLFFERSFSLRTLVTYQPHIVYATTGLPSQDMGGVAFSSNNLMASPRVRATLLARYSPVENFTVDVMEKWRSKLRQVAEPSIVSSSDIPTVAYTNLNLDYRMERGGGEAQVFLNIQNLFDRDPPPGAFYGANTAPGLYGGYVNGDDVIGRYYTLGLRYRL